VHCHRDSRKQDADKAVSLGTDLPVVFVQRADILYERGDAAGAIRDLDKAIALKPDDPLPYWVRGRMRFEKGDTKSAHRDFDQAAALFSKIEGE